MNKKTLYLEAAGRWDPAEYGALNSCRIRTAFSLSDGRRVYLECSRWAPSKEQIKYLNAQRTLKNKAKSGRAYIHIDFAYYITDETDANGWNISNENKNNIPIDRYNVFEWTPENLLQLVNSFGAAFDAVEVLPNLAGYSVHRSPYSQRGGNIKNYNYGDEFIYNKAQTAERLAIEKVINEQDKRRTGEKFPAFSFAPYGGGTSYSS